MNENHGGRVRAQTTTKAANEQVIGPVDVLIAAATWDQRCLAVTEVQWTEPPRHVILIRYADRGESGRVEANERRLKDHFRGAGYEVLEVEVDSLDMVKGWAAVKAAIMQHYQQLKRPLRVALDLNSISRYLTLSLMGLGSRTGIVAGIISIYSAAGEYISSNRRHSFTTGKWRPRAIPTLGVGGSPSARSLLVVAAGFEGPSTLRLVNALEPDRVAIALSDGIRPEHTQEARKANLQLAEEYILEESVIWLPAQDVAGSVHALSKSSLREPDRSGSRFAINFLLCGTKLSALAIGLYALDHDVAQVYYSQPEGRVEGTVASIEWVTVVDIVL